LDTIQTLVTEHGVPLLAALILIGELGVPTGVPMELALLAVGAFAIQSPLALVFGILVLIVADVIGSTALHLAARHGSGFIARRFSSPDGKAQRMLDRLEGLVGGRDLALVCVGRSLPLARMWVSLGTGISHIRFRNWLIGTTVGSSIWIGSLVLVGYLFRTSAVTIADRYSAYTAGAVFLMPALGLLAVAVVWIRRGHSIVAQLHRGRALLAVVSGTVALAFVAFTAAESGWLPTQHTLSTLEAALWAMPVWTRLLLGMGLFLWVAGVADLWSTRFLRFIGVRGSRLLLWEAAITASTVTLIVWGGLVAYSASLQIRLP